MDQLFPLVRLRDLQYCFPQKLLVCILMSVASGTSTKDLGSDFLESHASDLSLANESEDSEHHPAPVPVHKGACLCGSSKVHWH